MLVEVEWLLASDRLTSILYTEIQIVFFLISNIQDQKYEILALFDLQDECDIRSMRQP